MAKAKKIITKSKSQERRESSLAEARPKGPSKDPLAEGNTLKNPTNSEAETHYEIKERSSDVRKVAATPIDDESAAPNELRLPSLPASEVPNGDTDEQDEVAAGRVE